MSWWKYTVSWKSVCEWCSEWGSFLETIVTDILALEHQSPTTVFLESRTATSSTSQTTRLDVRFPYNTLLYDYNVVYHNKWACTRRYYTLDFPHYTVRNRFDVLCCLHMWNFVNQLIGQLKFQRFSFLAFFLAPQQGSEKYEQLVKYRPYYVLNYRIRCISLLTGENVGNNLNHLSQLLRVYEDSFSTREPVKLQCTQQDRRMSEYVFETGKMDPEEYERIHNGPDYRDKVSTKFECASYAMHWEKWETFPLVVLMSVR